MKRFTAVGLGLAGLAVLFGLLAGLGVLEVVSGVVLGVLALVLSIPAFVMGRIGRGFERDAARVKELPSRGVRTTGRVKDVVAYASPHGGAVLRPEGAQLVLQVEVPRGAGRTDLVTLHLVENSERARARIGTEVTVVEHPEEPSLRALEGYLPNGLRA